MERRGIETEVGRRMDVEARVRRPSSGSSGRRNSATWSASSGLGSAVDVGSIRGLDGRSAGARSRARWGAKTAVERSGMDPEQGGLFDGLALEERPAEVPPGGGARGAPSGGPHEGGGPESGACEAHAGRAAGPGAAAGAGRCVSVARGARSGSISQATVSAAFA